MAARHRILMTEWIVRGWLLFLIGVVIFAAFECAYHRQHHKCYQAVLNHLEDQAEIQHHDEYEAKDKLWLLAAEEDLLKMQCRK